MAPPPAARHTSLCVIFRQTFYSLLRLVIAYTTSDPRSVVHVFLLPCPMAAATMAPRRAGTCQLGVPRTSWPPQTQVPRPTLAPGSERTQAGSTFCPSGLQGRISVRTDSRCPWFGTSIRFRSCSKVPTPTAMIFRLVGLKERREKLTGRPSFVFPHLRGARVLSAPHPSTSTLRAASQRAYAMS